MTVVLYATLGKYHPQGKGSEPFTLRLPCGSTVEELLGKLGLDKDKAKQVFVEYASCSRDYILKDGQKAAIFPPIAGG